MWFKEYFSNVHIHKEEVNLDLLRKLSAFFNHYTKSRGICFHLYSTPIGVSGTLYLENNEDIMVHHGLMVGQK